MLIALRFSLCLALLATASTAFAQPPCTVPDNGTGTVDLPPPGCEYLSPTEFHMIVDGLPPGTTIRVDPIHSQFFNVQPRAGGNLGGEIETFDSFLTMEMTGTGELAGFHRTISMQINCEAHTGPRGTGSVQTFPNEMVQLQGAIFGDPDFDLLTVQGGTNFGMPSPGQTTLTRLGPPGSDFQVDSFFDIEYRIDFQGAPGSVLAGMSGSTQASVRMSTPSSTTTTVPANDLRGMILLVVLIMATGGAVLYKRVVA